MKVVFVGDKPSRLNDDPNVAFVGTPSFINLCRWIVKMQVTDFVMVNSHDHQDLVKICQLWNEGYRCFVALGRNAGSRLDKMNIDNFELPHPSPRNRKLNNKKLIDSELERCYRYIKDQKNVYCLR